MAELLDLVIRYVKKPEPEPEPRTEKYEISIAKATENGQRAQVTIELPGRKIRLLRVAKVYDIGSELANIQYRVISSTETGIGGDIEEPSPGRIEDTGKEDDDYDHWSPAHPPLRPAIEPAKEPIAQVEDPQWPPIRSKPSTQSRYEPARVVEKGIEETVKTSDALTDGSCEDFIQAICRSNVETQPIWEELEVVQNPILATDVSEDAGKPELGAASQRMPCSEIRLHENVPMK